MDINTPNWNYPLVYARDSNDSWAMRVHCMTNQVRALSKMELGGSNRVIFESIRCNVVGVWQPHGLSDGAFRLLYWIRVLAKILVKLRANL